MEHFVEIVSGRRFNGSRWIAQGSYSTSYLGELIGEWRVPSCDAARWLLANGKANREDKLTICREGRPALSGSVGWLAGHTVEENDKVSPRWIKYRPFVLGTLDSAETLDDGAQDGEDAAAAIPHIPEVAKAA